MKQSILTKLETLGERHEEVGALLSDSEVIADQNRFRDLSREYSELENVVQCYQRYRQVREDIEEARNMLQDSDPSELLFNEQSQLSQLRFRFSEEVEPINYVSALAAAMHVYEPQDTLQGPYIMTEYDAAMLEEVVSQVRPDNALT